MQTEPFKSTASTHGILQQTFSGDETSFGYYLYSGTSMATPHVAGVAALLLSESSELLPAHIQEILETTATDLGDAGWDSDTGWGLLNASAALEYVSTPVHDIKVSSVTCPTVAALDSQVQIVAEIDNSGSYDETVDVVLQASSAGTTLDTQQIALAAGESTTVAFTGDATGEAAGTYTLTVTASPASEDAEPDNNESTVSIELKEAVHDVAVTAFNLPLETDAGETLNLTATLENQGTYDESVEFVLSNTTTGQSLATETINLESAESTAWTYAWDTSSMAAGEYTITASLTPVSEETETSNNAVSQTITINEAEAVSKIAITSVTVTQTNTRIQVNAVFNNTGNAGDTVTAQCVILDQSGTRIVDNSPADQEMTLEADATQSLSWTFSSRLSSGTYLAQVSLIEYPVISSATQFTISSKNPKNDRDNNPQRPDSRNNPSRNNTGNNRGGRR